MASAIPLERPVALPEISASNPSQFQSKGPQSNSMAEALVKTIKRDYAKFARKPDAARVLASLHLSLLAILVA